MLRESNKYTAYFDLGLFLCVLFFSVLPFESAMAKHIFASSNGDANLTSGNVQNMDIVQELNEQEKILSHYKNQKKTKAVKRLIKSVKKKIDQLTAQQTDFDVFDEFNSSTGFQDVLGAEKREEERPLTPLGKSERKAIENSVGDEKQLNNLKVQWCAKKEIIHHKEARLREYHFVGRLIYDIRETEKELSQEKKQLSDIEKRIKLIESEIDMREIQEQEHFSAEGSREAQRHIEEEDKKKDRIDRIRIIREAFWLKIKILKSSLRWFQIGWKPLSQLNESDKTFVRDYKKLMSELDRIASKLGIEKIDLYKI